MPEDSESSSNEHIRYPVSIPVGTLVVVYNIGIGLKHRDGSKTTKGLVVSSPPPGAGVKDSYEVQLESGELVPVRRGYLTTLEDWEATREWLSGEKFLTREVNTDLTKT